MDPPRGDERPHAPPPTLWPVGFAVGIACVLVGLVIGSWPSVAVGAAITVVFAFLWVRDVTAEYRGTGTGLPHTETEEAPAPASGPVEPIPAHEGEAALPQMDEAEVERFPRSKFLEGATLGLGGVIGGLVTVPALGFAVAPAFVGQEADEVDVGPIAEFPERQWRLVTFMRNPEEGEVSRRTAYVRNNGLLNGQPSFTIVSNRCAHLGCPVQPNGPINEDAATREETENTDVTRIPTQPAGFGCPCHGGQYDSEGNRTAGPPVRALDRYRFSIRNGRLLLGDAYSVGQVEGEGAEARIERYQQAFPGVHVDGIERWLYPVEPPK